MKSALLLMSAAAAFVSEQRSEPFWDPAAFATGDTDGDGDLDVKEMDVMLDAYGFTTVDPLEIINMADNLDDDDEIDGPSKDPIEMSDEGYVLWPLTEDEGADESRRQLSRKNCYGKCNCIPVLQCFSCCKNCCEKKWSHRGKFCSGGCCVSRCPCRVPPIANTPIAQTNRKTVRMCACCSHTKLARVAHHRRS